MDKSFLIKKANTYYVRLIVPKHLRAVVGKTKLTRSLQTGDLATANREKHRVLDELHGELAAAASSPKKRGPSAAEVMEFAREQRALVDAGEQSPDDAEEQVALAAEAYRLAAEKLYGVDRETGDAKLPPDALRSIRGAQRVVHGEPVVLLTDAIGDYLKEKARHLTKQTVNEKRRHLSRFSAWMGEGVEVADITRKNLGDFLKMLTAEPKEKGGRPGDLKSARTVADDFAHVAGFFSWLVQRGQLTASPAEKMAGTVKASTRGSEDEKRAFTGVELKVILQGLPKNDPLWSLAALALYTGMRLDEVANLKTDDVESGFLRVRAGKTKAAIRRVPVHASISPLAAQLAATTDDGYLLPGLLRGGEDAKRGKLIGKRFLDRLRNGLEIVDPLVDFHSFRRSFQTSCEEHGIPESTVKLLVGHARQSLTFGLYSKGISDEALNDAMKRVSFGRDIDSLVKRCGKDVVITMRSRPRRKSRKKLA